MLDHMQKSMQSYDVHFSRQSIPAHQRKPSTQSLARGRLVQTAPQTRADSMHTVRSIRGRPSVRDTLAARPSRGAEVRRGGASPLQLLQGRLG